MSDALTELIRDANRNITPADRHAILDLIEQQADRIAALEAQIAAVAPAVDAQPVAWLIERGDALPEATATREYADLTRRNGSKVTPLYASAQSEGLRKALTEIAEQEHVELMLDPTWAQRVAIAALSQHTGEQS